MSENLYVGSHKCTNKAWRDGWDRTFKKDKTDEKHPSENDKKEIDDTPRPK